MAHGSGATPRTITEEEVVVLARAVGLAIPPDRLAAVAQRLTDMYELAAVIEDADLDGFELPSRFDPSWPGEESVR